MFLDYLDYFNNHYMDVDLTQNRETMAFQTLEIVESIQFIMFIEIAFGRGPGHI